MTAVTKVRLLIEETGTSGSWNMALDEFLLTRALEAGELSVRIYAWNSATVSLGYFQNATEFRASEQFPGIPAVRRLSGGGAILHDREVTYSICTPPQFPLTADPVGLYEAAHHAIISVFSTHNVTLSARGTNLQFENEPFLCFSRGDRNDLVLDGTKVVGSAQRRRKRAVLQHGSILMDASPHAPSLLGITNLAELTSSDEIPAKLGHSILRAIAGAIEQTLRGAVTELSSSEIDEVHRIEQAHYCDLDQIRSRNQGEST